jgi:hypothetical protein
VIPPTKIRLGIVVPNRGGLRGGIIDVGVMLVVVVEGVPDEVLEQRFPV